MTREEFIEAAGKRYDRLQALNDGRDFYDYEKEFINIWEDLGREVFEKNINTASEDRRKKKLAVATGK
ncbi:hypothetical protein [Mucilaginibacter sp. OK283]|jgi:hypothetical protein|uniref:hypothetical protein n=1 Tax=Mucilaginibacter sp. OK283 TaxID=1881049 RepID=UPI0008B75C01|nr:hypothetical protein [Mucilaginibacter sp. OK283]SEO65401.1 hypothetical protein SAMN05428947_103282 [Mucilaginibacter sp. OK283]